MTTSYTLGQLVALSGASKNEATTWVQKALIRANVRDTTGTGAHRAFDFLNVFEACVARQLNLLPGGMPTVTMLTAMQAIREGATTRDAQLTAWGLFLNPQTRDANARFWLALYRPQPVIERGITLGTIDMAVVVGSDERDRLDASADVLVTVRLDTLLLDLERRTDDHTGPLIPTAIGDASATESLPAAIESAMRREFHAVGLPDHQIASVLDQLHEKLATVRPALRASATFLRYVEMIDAIVKITGPGPNYAKWRRGVDDVLRRSKQKKASGLDDQILKLLAARDAERHAGAPEPR